MNSSFKKILVPVDFSLNTEVAIQIACKMAQKNAALHLLYVQCYGYPLLSFSALPFLWPDEKKDRKNAESGLQMWRRRIIAEHQDITVTFGIDTRHDVQGGIINTCREFNPDLVIIVKSSQHSWLPFLNTVRPEKIAKKICAPVLVCKPGSLNGFTREILVPVNEKIDERKLQVIEAVSHTNNIHAWLVAFDKNINTPALSSTLSQYYQRIRFDRFGLADSRIIPSGFRPKKLLDIASKLNTDMLILKPGNETKMNFMGGQIFDDLDPLSELQVILVN